MKKEMTIDDLMEEVNEHYIERGRIEGMREGEAKGKIEGKIEAMRSMLERLGEQSGILLNLLTDEEKAMISSVK